MGGNLKKQVDIGRNRWKYVKQIKWQEIGRNGWKYVELCENKKEKVEIRRRR